jgi:hypothetical protein
MRLLSPLLLGLALIAAPLHADDQPEATPKERITSHLQQLRAAEGHLLDMCANSSLSVSAGLIAMYEGRCGEAEAMLGRLSGGSVSDPEVTIIEGRLQRVSDGLTALSGFIQATDPKTIGDQYKHVAGTPELAALHDFVKDTSAVLMKALAAQGQLEPAATQGMENERQRRDLVLKLVDAARDAGEAMKDTPGWSAPAAFTTGVSKVRALLDLAALPANPDPAKLQELQDRCQARIEACKVMAGYLQDLLHADTLSHGWASPKPRLAQLTAAEQAVATAGAAAAQALIAGLASAFSEVAEAKPAAGVLDHLNQAHDAVLTPLHEAFDRYEETWDALNQAEDAGKDAAEQIARCTTAQHDLQARSEQALGEIAAGARARLVAAAATDRVAGFEAKAVISLAQVALDRVHEEAQIEGDLDEAGQPWKGHEKDAAVVEPLKRYLAQRAKLRAAQAMVLKDALAAESLRARLEVLDFKKQLQDGAAQGHNQERDAAKDELEGITQALNDALQGGPVNRERDAKDAGRIPLVAPGDEKF